MLKTLPLYIGFCYTGFLCNTLHCVCATCYTFPLLIRPSSYIGHWIKWIIMLPCRLPVVSSKIPALFFICLALCTECLPDEQRLVGKLFNKLTYDNSVRPVFNSSENVVVGFGFSLIQVMDMVSITFLYSS